MKKLTMSIFGDYIDNIHTIRDSFKNKNFLYLISLTCFAIFLFLTLCAPFQPFVFIGNVFIVLFFLLTIALVIKRKKISLNVGVAWLVLYIIITSSINLTLHSFALSPIVTICLLLFIYEFVACLDKGEQKLVIRILYLSLIVLMALCYLRYFPKWIHTRKVSIFNDLFFGNLDGLSNYFAAAFILSLYYFKKGNFLSLAISVLSLFFIIMTERRTALLICLVGALVYIYLAFFRHRLVTFLLIALAIILFGMILMMTVPALQSIGERFFGVLYRTFFTYAGHYDGETRWFIIQRGLYITFSNFFGGLGYDNIVHIYGESAAHDFLGDLSMNYGGLFSLISFTVFTGGAINLIRRKNEFSYLTMTVGILFFLLLFLATFVYNRTYCIIGGLCLGLIEKKQEKKAAISTYCVSYKI